MGGEGGVGRVWEVWEGWSEEERMDEILLVIGRRKGE